MKIFNLQFDGKGTRELKGKVEEMELALGKSIKAQESLGAALTSVTTQQSTYVGNAYRKYEQAIKAIEAKYNGTAEWGTVLTGNIIDLRAAFIIGNGIEVVRREGVTKQEAETELKWAADFLEYNKLDRELTQELAKEAEIEGKIALKLYAEDIDDEDGWHEHEKMISVRYVSYSDKKYEVETPEDDYMNYEKLIWQEDDGTDKTLEAEAFVYNKFGGRIHKPNDAQPKIMKCLTQIDDVDKALRDWREINRIFAAPILDVECNDKEAVTQAEEYLKGFNMRIKKAFIHSGSKVTMISPPMAGVESLKEEIITKIKIIAGNVSLPIHFLGLLDLLKNRSTGDNTREMIIAGTSKERQVWEATYAEVIEKAMDLYNADIHAKKSKGSQLDSSKIDVVIPVYTQEQWDHIEKVLLPLYLGGAISIETLLSNVPGLDAEGETEKLADKEATEVEISKAENEALKDELNFQKAGFKANQDGQQQ